MKKWLFIIIGIILIGVISIGIKINSGFNKVGTAFHSKHVLEAADLVLISEAISPNKTYKYYEYQFDNGGFGYSRVFWSVIKHNNDTSNLEHGRIPDGYKTIGWNNENELILEQWKPYYAIKQTELKNGMEINGVKIKIVNHQYSE